MKITYTARKVNLRDNFKERAEKKLKKFEKLFSDTATVNVVVTLEKNRQTVEITVRDKGMVYRAESTMSEMNDALDKTVDILYEDAELNRIISTLLDLYDELPLRPDAAFDVAFNRMQDFHKAHYLRRSVT